MEKVKKPFIVGLILILLCTYGVYQHYFTGNSDIIEASGTIEATQVKVSAKLSGTLDQVSVAEGAKVQPDEVIAVLSRPDLEVQRERDLLSIELAQAKLKDLQAGARPQELQEAYASLNISRENLAKAEADLKRVEQLYEQGAMALQELEAMQLKVDLAQNQFSIAQSKVDLINAGPRAGAVEAAVIELNRMEAVLKATDTMMADLTIKSPLAGTILSSNYEPGEFIQMGAAIATVANLNDLWITVYIPSDELSYISLEQPVQCFVAGDATVYPGKVTHIADHGEFTPKMIQTKKERANIVFAVKVAVENQDNRLKPGMPADVAFKRGE